MSRARCLLAAIALVACAPAAPATAPESPRPPTRTAAPAPAPPTIPAPPPPTTRAAPQPAPPPSYPCAPPDDRAGDGPAAAELSALLERRLADPRLAATELSVSIWVEGLGEVLAHGPNRRLLPASNQKLLTAIGALALLDGDERLTTEVLASGEVVAGELQGDLVLVGGGDATLAAAGSHSLQALAAGVAAAGVERVRGRLLVDEGRYDALRTARGWLDWQVPDYVGPLSALMVDDNRHRRDADFLADPAPANGELFREVLADEGVQVDGPAVHGRAAGTFRRLASLESPTIAALVRAMLHRSDNEVAELLLKEIGYLADGVGSTDGGLARISEALRPLCVPMAGTSGDGSGLSRANLRSAREWRRLLQAATTASWGDELVQALPVAGRSGTLAGRFAGTAAAGNLRAKTGSIIVGRALSGFLETRGGRSVVFSIVVNGDRPRPATGAIDDLVADLAAYPG